MASFEPTRSEEPITPGHADMHTPGRTMEFASARASGAGKFSRKNLLKGFSKSRSSTQTPGRLEASVTRELSDSRTNGFGGDDGSGAHGGRPGEAPSRHVVTVGRDSQLAQQDMSEHLTHVTFSGTETGRCALMHGTVYADPYPGFVHGVVPAICRKGCEPVLSKSLGETAEQKLWREADEFLDQFAHENGVDDETKEARKKEVRDSLARSGTYEHTFEELQWGARVAWRNHGLSPHRAHWNSLVVLDHRSADSPAKMFEGCKELLERASTHRGSVPYLAAFRPAAPGAKDGPRVWNSHLVRFACYERNDETLLGDPASKAFTDFCIRSLGWKPPQRRTAFDVLPVVLQAGPGEDPQMFELPPWYVPRVSIKHADAPWLWEMGIRWSGMPAVSGLQLAIGGLTYTAVPHTGWYMDTDVVRELTDPERYNLCKPIAAAMGLDTRTDGSLWRDKAVHLVNEAVMSSFTSAGWRMEDHHTVLATFVEWYKKEKAKRGYCPADVTAMMPGLSPALLPGGAALAGMTQYTLLPAWTEAPGFDAYKSALKELRQASRARPSRPTRFLPFNPYVARFLGAMRRAARFYRPRLVVVYSSVTGSTEHFARRLTSLLSDAFTVTLMSVTDFRTAPLAKAEAVVQMTSTWGAGGAPPSARAWLSYLNTAEAREALAGKPWATIGFGQKQYPRFCAAAELFMEMASEARVKHVQHVGKCDGDGNEEADYRLWVSDLLDRFAEEGLLKRGDLEALQARLTLEQADTTAPPQLLKAVPAPEGASAAKGDSTRFRVPVKAARQLLASTNGSADRATALVTLDLSAHPFVQFAPGDHLMVYPENSPKVVADVAANLGITAEKLDSLIALELADANAPEPFPSPTTYRDALAHHMDLDATPSPAALAAMAECVEECDPDASDKLHRLAGSSQEYQRWVVTEEPRWRDVFTLCPALQGRLPPERLFELCPATPPRYYSVASSLMAAPTEVAITVGQLSYHLPDGRKRKGLTSTYLTACKPGDLVSCSIASAPNFHLPMDPACPAIFVAAGVGIAPFRAFWSERAARAKHVGGLAPAVLFFGCRSKAADCLFQEELERAKASGGLSDVIYCFSQEPGMPRTYVQDGIDINADRLAALLATPTAHYYISGDAMMASSVAAVLQKAIGPEMCTRMQAEGRWHENVMGVAKSGKADAAAAAVRQRAKLKAMDWDVKARSVLLALRAGNMKTVRLKIEKLSEEERGWVDCDGRTFLHHVVMENKPKLVPVVNVLTAQAHIADAFSLTPRALAVVSGFDECASMLEVLEGPLVSSMNQDFYPVHAAVLRRDTDAVEEALSYGVRFSKQDSEGNLPLHCGVAANDAAIVAMLLAAGAPVHLPNRVGRSATQVALLLGFDGMAALLKRAGGLASAGQNKHADFSACGSVPNAASGLASRSDRLTPQQVAAVKASWGYLTASDFPDKTKERIVDLGVKIFHNLFKTAPEEVRAFPFADADGRPISSEVRKLGLRTFVAFGDIVDGLDNPDKTIQIFEHLVRALFKYGVKAEHYKHLNDAIVSTMEASLGDAWDEEQEDAWGAVLGLLLHVVSKAYANGTGTGGDTASMRQATEALARNASYRPQRIKFPADGARRTSAKSERAGSTGRGGVDASPPPPAHRTPPPSAADAPVPEGTAADRESAARAVIRSVSTQQSEQERALQERQAAATAAARPNHLALAQANAAARRGDTGAAALTPEAAARATGAAAAQPPPDAVVRVAAGTVPKAGVPVAAAPES